VTPSCKFNLAAFGTPAAVHPLDTIPRPWIMHPQPTSEKRLGATASPLVCSRVPIGVVCLSCFLIVCKEFIEALEGWSRFFGACNQAKHDLNMCLRRERIERTTRNRENAKVRREKTEKVWKELHQDD